MNVNPGNGADGDVDLTLNKDGKRILVQCKNWKARKAGVSTVRELFGIISAERAHQGIIVCSGHYTNEAIEFAKGKPLTLVDGASISRLIGDAQKMRLIMPEVKDTV